MLYEVSVIIPTFNRPEGLLRALESVFNQTHLNYEVIVIDNGGASESHKKIPASYFRKNNFDYIRFEETSTVGKRLNQAITLSRGKYIAFLTDDAFWCPEALENLFDAINVGVVDLVSGKVKTLDYYSEMYLPNNYGNFTWDRGEIKTINPIHLSSVIVSRNLMDKVGGFNELLHKSYDLDLWNRVYRNRDYVTGRIDESISHLVVNNPESLSKKHNSDLNTDLLDTSNQVANKINRRYTVTVQDADSDLLHEINKKKYNLMALSSKKPGDMSINWNHEENSLPDFFSTFNCLAKEELEKIKDDLPYKLSVSTLTKRLLLFIQSQNLSKEFIKINPSYTIGQERGGSYLNFSNTKIISQYVKCSLSEINGIEIFLDPQENHSGKIICSISAGSTKRLCSLENHQISHGWNRFQFETIQNSEGVEVVFSFKSDVSFFSVEFAQYKSPLGVLFINKKPLNASLKFKLF